MKTVRLKNGEVLTIRLVEESDAEALTVFLNAVGGESDFLLFGENEFRRTAEQERGWIRGQNAPNSVFYVGLAGGELVATAQLSAAQKPRIAHTSEFAISVRKAYWGLGVGSAMLESIVAFAKSTGTLEVIALGVYENNVRARKLYQKFGFEEIGRYRKFFKVNDSYYNEILMNLYL